MKVELQKNGLLITFETDFEKEFLKENF